MCVNILHTARRSPFVTVHHSASSRGVPSKVALKLALLTHQRFVGGVQDCLVSTPGATSAAIESARSSLLPVRDVFVSPRTML